MTEDQPASAAPVVAGGRVAQALRKALLDWRIGWNEGAADRHEMQARLHRERERRARRAYAEQCPSQWGKA